MIALILFAVLYLYVDRKNIHVSVNQLASAYQESVTQADRKFLKKKLELSGKVKSYYSFEEQPNLLELITEKSEIKVYCSFLSQKDDSLASTLTFATPVVISGTFKGIKNPDSPNHIYFEGSNLNIEQNK